MIVALVIVVLLVVVCLFWKGLLCYATYEPEEDDQCPF